MATPTRVDRHVEIGLEDLWLTLGDLPEVAQQWDGLGDGERASWSLDWDQLIGSHLYQIERQYRAGKLTTEQQTRYRAIRSRLAAALPTIERLGLYPPPVPLSD